MSPKPILPADDGADRARSDKRATRDRVTTPRSMAIRDDNGKIRVRMGLIAGRYGVRVYNPDGSVAYDFTVTP